MRRAGIGDRREQYGQQIFYLRQHEKALPCAQLFRRFHFAFQGLRIVKEDKARAAVGMIGEVAGAEGAAEIGGASLGQPL